MFDVNKFNAIQVSLASPEEIESWARKDTDGNPLEVTKPETINYRSQKPERDGLFCEKIFGPTKDYECYCGKYKKKAYAGTICEKCGVEITSKSVRRERMSFIRLAVPVTHIWYLKGTPSRIGQVLDIAPKDLEEVVYFVSHITLSAGKCKYLNYREVLDEQTAKDRFTLILKTAIEEGLIIEGSDDYNEAMGHIQSMHEDNFFDFYTISRFISKFYSGVEFGIGAEAIQRLLSEVNVEEEFNQVFNEMKEIKEKIKKSQEKNKDKNAKEDKNTTNSQKMQKLQKRIEVLDAFRKSGNKPEWMVLTNLPVIPPDLRPMLPLDGSRFASADLNELYRRVIQRNQTLKNMIQVQAPTVMLVNAKRMVQEAVDALIDNGRRSKAVTASGGRAYKSLSSTLKGKQGRFRQNLLGKRVDYSGRSVIAVGPNLRMDECGLPREMALQLFRPFIVRKLVEKGIATNTKNAETYIEKNDPKMWSCLDEVINEHPVLLNRAPTLHRLGIQAFHPRLVEGRAIRLFPLATTAFNADFDGDQMAVHVPLSNEAIWEAEHLMLGSKNILGPKDGKPIVTPTKDMVLGNYYLTMEESAEDFLGIAKEAEYWKDSKKEARYKAYAAAEGKVFASKEEAIVAYETDQIHIHNRIAIRGKGMHNKTFTEEQNKSYIVTTPGKLIFNQIFDDDFPYLNDVKVDDFKKHTSDKYFIKPGENIKEIIKNQELRAPFTKKQLSKIIEEFLKQFGVVETSEMLNKMKDQGFLYATKAAVTVSLFDIISLDEKHDIFNETQDKIDRYEDDYENGLLTDEERHKHVVDGWKAATDDIGNKIFDKFKADKRNPFFMMSDSGAGGNKSHFNQLAGMRGLMNKPNGDVIELPIKSSLREGLTVSEFFNSTHGTRKGGADTALKTAQSGYLTRRLVDVSHDFIVREEDCGCTTGIKVSTIYDTADGSVIEPFKPRLVGRYAMKDVVSKDGEVLCKGNTLITEAIADAIIEAGIEEVEIRSIFTCKCKDGVCRKCYGTNLATGKEVELGEAAGVMAAQSIGEPGTQLTMRNFNTGGVAGSTDITRGLPRVQELFEARTPKGEAIISEIDGTIDSIEEKDGKYTISVKNPIETRVYQTIFGAKLAKQLDEKGNLINDEAGQPMFLKAGCKVYHGNKLTEGAIYPKKLLEVTNNVETVEKYILKEVQKVYLPVQGIEISDKHIEVMVKQMFKKMIITDSGDTTLLLGQKVSQDQYLAANKIALTSGKVPATGRSIVLGITKASLDVESFLSAASFQETTRVLTDATVKGKTDYLHGLKENVIVGKLIPSGTGLNPNKRFATKDKHE